MEMGNENMGRKCREKERERWGRAIMKSNGRLPFKGIQERAAGRGAAWLMERLKGKEEQAGRHKSRHESRRELRDSLVLMDLEGFIQEGRYEGQMNNLGSQLRIFFALLWKRQKDPTILENGFIVRQTNGRI